jgi:hypothetical protein
MILIADMKATFHTTYVSMFFLLLLKGWVRLSPDGTLAI